MPTPTVPLITDWLPVNALPPVRNATFVVSVAFGRLVSPLPSPTNAVAFTVPTTCSAVVGLFVPMPTRPFPSTAMTELVGDPPDQRSRIRFAVPMPAMPMATPSPPTPEEGL